MGNSTGRDFKKVFAVVFLGMAETFERSDSKYVKRLLYLLNVSDFLNTELIHLLPDLAF
jgi:hypothetical protein